MKELVNMLYESLEGIPPDQARTILENFSEVILEIQFSADQSLACQVIRDLIHYKTYSLED